MASPSSAIEVLNSLPSGSDAAQAVVVNAATFEALLEAGLLECRFGRFLYKGIGPVVQAEAA